MHGSLNLPKVSQNERVARPFFLAALSSEKKDFPWPGRLKEFGHRESRKVEW